MIKIIIILVITLFFAGCISNNDLVFKSESQLKHDNAIKIVTTWTQEPPCINYGGHGDGICGHSREGCFNCNCSLTIEKWCDNETLELEEELRQSKQDGE